MHYFVNKLVNSMVMYIYGRKMSLKWKEKTWKAPGGSQNSKPKKLTPDPGQGPEESCSSI